MDYEERGPGREGEEVTAADVLGQRAGQTSLQGSGVGGRQGSGLPAQRTDSVKHIKPSPRGCFPKAGGGVCDQGLPLAL